MCLFLQILLQATVEQKALYLVSAQVYDEDTGDQLPGAKARVPVFTRCSLT
jgi:hypothetical protein